MPKTITPQQRRANLTLDAANAASCAQALADHLMDASKNDGIDADEVKRLVRAIEQGTCRIRRNVDQVVAEAGAIPATTTQRVVVVGPNLPASLSSQGTFHVHAEGCADLKRGAIRPYAEREQAAEYANLTDLCDDVYPPEDFGCESGEYLHDFHIAPCVHLPVA